MIEKLVSEVINQGLQEAAYRLGKELGLELRNYNRFNRGELEWDELTHLQKTLFLGGDRNKYERIRSVLRQRNQRKDSSGRSSLDNMPQKPERKGGDGRFFDYERF